MCTCTIHVHFNIKEKRKATLENLLFLIIPYGFYTYIYKLFEKISVWTSESNRIGKKCLTY